ncbi:MAG: CHAT domain-containing tetratricopeptide repeat protein [Bacteroidia bacterium]|nr:CHAT domain-containing tetratricopeptide repeat protein [Bacteroidia bacterium]
MRRFVSLVICIGVFWGKLFSQTPSSPADTRANVVILREKGQNFLRLSETDSAARYLSGAEILAEKHLSPSDPDRIRVWLVRAELQLALDQYSEAIRHLEKAYESSAKAQITDLQIESLTSLGYAACVTNRYPEAEKYLTEAETLLNARSPLSLFLVAKLRFCQGYYLQLRQDYPPSLEKYEESRKLFSDVLAPDDPEVARALNFAGQVYRAMGENEKATEYHLEALHIQQKKLPEEHLELARTYLYLGICAYETGDYAAALDYYAQALRIRRRKLGEKHRLVASVYNNLGLVFWMEGEPEKALNYYSQVVAIYVELLGKDDLGVAAGYNNMGLCYTDMHNYREAIHYFRLALQIRQKRQGNDHPSLAGIYNNIGLAELTDGQYDKAIQGFREAMRIGEKHEGFHHVRVAKYYNNIGRVYREKNDPVQALQWHQQALIHAIAGYNDTQWCSNPPVKSFPLSPDFLEILHHKALSINLLPPNLSNSECALNTYQAAAELIDLMRVHYLSDDAKFRLAARAAEIYAGGITTARKLYLISGKNKKYLDIALRFSEKQKAIVLLEALNSARAKNIGMLPDALLQMEKNVRKTRVELQEAIFEERQKGASSDSLKIAEISAQLFTVGRQYDSLTFIFDSQFPRYYQLKYQSEPPGAEDIIRNLPKGTALVEYYHGGGNLHIFLLSEGRSDWLTLPATDTLNLVVSHFQESIYQGFRNLQATDSLRKKWSDDYELLADSLYQMLIAPLTEKPLPEKLILIPDGVLGYIPFDALLTEKPAKKGAYRDYPYLIRKFTLSQHYSAALLFRSLPDRESRQSVKNAVIYAPVFSPEMNYPDVFGPPAHLPFSELEAEKITRLTGGDIFLKEKATKAAFFDHAGGYRIIHLSSHARVNDRDPMFSTIDFADGEAVNVLELFGIELRADLVTLSACETGNGELFRGEGIMSLSRGFIYAGAKSIVNTLWEVNDGATAEIMTHFYETLSKGKSKDEALRYAKTEWLSQADHLTAHPYYWSGYIAVGDMTPLPRNPFPLYLIIMLGGAFAGIILLFRIFRRK